ncbi:MAG: DnaD domain protein [Erysipelotrichaceae bacterium]|jgi:replication initiation and membrane attachment protein|nr:DnaD domain protein [Erysipelotrichaceae bacterium]
MNLLGSDYYEMIADVSLSQEDLFSLCVLYQPLIGHSALSLYLTLANNEGDSHTHLELCTLMACSIDVIEEGRSILEQYGLLSSWHKESEQLYRYQLKKPLAPENFLDHYIYGLAYRKMVGAIAADQVRQRFARLEVSGFTEVTKVLDSSRLLASDVKELKEFLDQRKVKPMKENESFNQRAFLRGLRDINFPLSLRTPENLEMISNLAVVYGISEKRMGALVSRSTSYQPDTFDKEKLAKLAKAEAVENEANKTGYEMAPVLFLKELQQGVGVSEKNKALLEELVRTYQLPGPVINVLIEYAITTRKSKTLSPAHALVREIALSWKLNNIETVEQAQNFLASWSGRTKPANSPAQPPLTHKQQDLFSLEQSADIDAEYQKLIEELKALEKQS